MRFLLTAALLLVTPSVGAQPAGGGPGAMDSREEAYMLARWRTEGALGIPLSRALLLAGGAAPFQLPVLEDAMERILDEAERRIRLRNSAWRQARALFHHLHRQTLRHYDVSAMPADLLDGRYNCVTATALFVLASERLGVPVAIRATPVHVFAVVDPGGAEIRVEMTEPQRGFGYDGGREGAVRMLRTRRLVTEHELARRGEDAVYRMALGDEQPITPEQLVGAVYHNAGVAATEAGDFERALAAFGNALAFGVEVVDTRSYFDNALLGIVYGASDASTVLHSVQSAFAWRGNDQSFGPTAVAALEALLPRLRHEEQFEQTVDLIERTRGLIGGLDTARPYLDQLEAVVHYDWARALLRQGTTGSGVAHSARAHAFWPDNFTIHDLHVRATGDLAIHMASKGEAAAALEALERLGVSPDDFPVLVEIIGDVATLIVRWVDQKASSIEHEAAVDLLLRARALVPQSEPVREALAWVFHSLAMEQVRAHQLRAAEMLIRKGLEHAPSSQILLDDLAVVRAHP